MEYLSINVHQDNFTEEVLTYFEGHKLFLHIVMKKTECISSVIGQKRESQNDG